MGAQGGVVYIPLRDPSKYSRVTELLGPFWQYLCQNACSDWAESEHSKWETENSCVSQPTHLFGHYGTDRGDFLDLHDLRDLCQHEPEEGYDDSALYDLTFDEMDLECRTKPAWIPMRGYLAHPLHRLWYEHFERTPREGVLKNLGSLAHIRIADWCDELRKLLHFDHLGVGRDLDLKRWIAVPS